MQLVQCEHEMGPGRVGKTSASWAGDNTRVQQFTNLQAGALRHAVPRSCTLGLFLPVASLFSLLGEQWQGRSSFVELCSDRPHP